MRCLIKPNKLNHHDFPDEFIHPKSWGNNTRVRVLTTTRQFPVLPDSRPDIVRWSPTTHPRGVIIEDAFARHGCDLARFLPAAPLWLNQMHGTDVFDADSIPAEIVRATPPIADAAITRVPDTVLAILSADCLPVVLADERDGVIAAAHAGWRGLAAGVLEATVEKMAVVPERLVAWLGPAIGAATFEVGQDVFDVFRGRDDCEAATCFAVTGGNKYFADIYALARLRLERIGVTRIDSNDFCTYTDQRRFYSHRRKKSEGRMATFAWFAST
ncbi:MAG: peptidoglycan editing factor PgeF [Burkholderiales bacterium]|jgi:YfiH family protein|nr:peptidoglycan editing factor PgeF [Burkholderiales bacterium]